MDQAAPATRRLQPGYDWQWAALALALCRVGEGVCRVPCAKGPAYDRVTEGRLRGSLGRIWSRHLVPLDRSPLRRTPLVTVRRA